MAVRVWKRRNEQPSTPAWALEEREYEVLCAARLAHLVPVREPLVLVSQLHRSGGTLLSQLLDGHPECHAHPHELRIGKVPNSRHWPRIDLDRPETWFETLYEKYAGKHFRSGYSKVGGKSAPAANRDVFPFLFLPGLQRRIFDQCVAQTRVERERDVLDCYFTSYFNAWLDNHSLYSTPKRVVTAFAPEMNLRRKSREALFAAYPDGALVSIVREPRAWFASARSQRGRDRIVEVGMERWRRSAELTLEAIELYGDRMVALTFEELVLDTETTMARLAARIGISMSACLLEPTFNGRPIRANSSYAVERHGVLTDRVGAYREQLDDATLAQVDELAGDVYERIREVSVARS